MNTNTAPTPRSFVFAALLLCRFAAGAFASDHAAILDELNSDDYQTRQNATQRLFTDETLTLEQITELYAVAQTVEQKHRLLAAAQHHALTRLRDARATPHDKGAIGLTHEIVTPVDHPDLDHPAIQVMHTLPGFPGHAHLRTDDLIVGFGGEPIPDDVGRQGFNQLIKERRRGDAVELAVLRDGRRVLVRFRLAGFRELSMLYDGKGSLALRSAFNDQWLGVHDAIVSGGPLPELPAPPKAE